MSFFLPTLLFVALAGLAVIIKRAAWTAAPLDA
jgi:hypothetical protein